MIFVILALTSLAVTTIIVAIRLVQINKGYTKIAQLLGEELEDEINRQ